MSYADVAAKGPKQSNAEKVPDAVPEIAHSDSGVHSLDSLSTNHVSSMPSYADQQLAAERAEEAEREAKREADEMAEQAKQFTAQANAELDRLESKAGKKYNEWSQEAKASYDTWKKQARNEFEKGKKEARKGEAWAEKNKDNPVVIGNAVAITAVAALVGVGAYRLHSTGDLNAKTVGIGAAVLGAFALGDYYVSQFFFKKYPPKQ